MLHLAGNKAQLQLGPVCSPQGRVLSSPLHLTLSLQRQQKLLLRIPVCWEEISSDGDSLFQLCSLLSPTGLRLKPKERCDRCMLRRLQSAAISSLAEVHRQSPLQSFPTRVLHVLTRPPPLPLAPFFKTDCSCWFCCLRFYCLKLEQMVIVY